MKRVIISIALIFTAGSAQACEIELAQRAVREASIEATQADAELSETLGSSEGINREAVEAVEAVQLHVQKATDKLTAAIVYLTMCQPQG